MNKKAAISLYIISILCLLGLIALLVYSSFYDRTTSPTASFTLSDAAILGLAAWTVPMWAAAAYLMKALRLKGTLHEKENRIMIVFPAVVCSGFALFYGIVLLNMLFR
jgi:hypothetical protein